METGRCYIYIVTRIIKIDARNVVKQMPHILEGLKRVLNSKNLNFRTERLTTCHGKVNMLWMRKYQNLNYWYFLIPSIIIMSNHYGFL